eukprot:4788580-Pleurochrysis_carterae.AAC.1
MKYVGVLPGEGTVPAVLPLARQGLHAIVLHRIEDVVGEARLPAVEQEAAKLAEGILAADVDLPLA